MDRVRMAWTVCVDGCEPGVRYAPTRAKARASAISDIRDAWDCTWMEAAGSITSIRRAPEQDVILPLRHALADQMGDKLLHIVVHAYGGKSLKAGYRDHFFTSAIDSDLLRLTELGVFEKGETLPARTHGAGMAYFTLTDLGRAVAAGEQPEYPA